MHQQQATELLQQAATDHPAGTGFTTSFSDEETTKLVDICRHSTLEPADLEETLRTLLGRKHNGHPPEELDVVTAAGILIDGVGNGGGDAERIDSILHFTLITLLRKGRSSTSNNQRVNVFRWWYRNRGTHNVTLRDFYATSSIWVVADLPNSTDAGTLALRILERGINADDDTIASMLHLYDPDTGPDAFIDTVEAVTA